MEQPQRLKIYPQFLYPNSPSCLVFSTNTLKKSRVLQKVLNFNSRCQVFQTTLSFLMWMICVRNRPPSLSLLHPIPAVLSCRGNRKDLPWMSVLASSWSGLNLTGVILWSTIQLCQSPSASRKGWLHPDCLWWKIPQSSELPNTSWRLFGTSLGGLGQSCARDNCNNRKQILGAQNYFTMVDLYFKTFPSSDNGKSYWISFFFLDYLHLSYEFSFPQKERGVFTADEGCAEKEHVHLSFGIRFWFHSYSS